MKKIIACLLVLWTLPYGTVVSGTGPLPRQNAPNPVTLACPETEASRDSDTVPKTFHNPLLPSGADPYSFFKDGFYYYTNTRGDRIELWKTRDLTELGQAEHKVIFAPGQGKPWSRDLWAPEVMFLQGKWYAYFAADKDGNPGHRLFVLENASPDPLQGVWTMKGRLADSADKWAIDGDVFAFRGRLYLLWSGWEGDRNGRQDLYIAPMSNPWTVSGRRVKLSSPEYPWERYGDLNSPDNPPHVDVNEGPQALLHGNDLFVVYSASGCWTDQYALGLLRFSGKGDPLDPSQWKKSAQPVFRQSPANEVFAPGHNSFFKSPDGTQDWILYHANAHIGEGCGNRRSPRAQPFRWKENGEPDFGEPVSESTGLTWPAEGNGNKQ